VNRVRAGMWAAAAPVRWLLLGLIGVYRVSLSGLLGGQCRFYPSCSEYARDAIALHGAARGSAFAVARILRCGPFTAGGVDRVPEPRGQGRESRVYDSVIHEERTAS
jgi:uncharacterized protein